MAENIVEKINTYLLETEALANEYLPLKDKLDPIKYDFNDALNKLKEKADSCDDIADRVFYINRYTDLIKRMESIFDTRSKRLQQTISMLTKLPSTLTEGSEAENNADNKIDDTINKPLTPEQTNEILKILNNNKGQN